MTEANVLKTYIICTALAAAIAAPQARAESAGMMEATRIELNVIAAMPMAQGATGPSKDRTGKTVQTIIASATTIVGELGAAYPKCHFRVASLVLPDADAGVPPMPQMMPQPIPPTVPLASPPQTVRINETLVNVKARLVLIGDAGCLLPAVSAVK